MCWIGRRDGSVEEAMGGAPSHDATCHGASRLVSRSDIDRFKGMAFDKASIQVVSSVLWNPSVSVSEQSYPQKAWNLKETPCTESKISQNFIIYGEESSRNGMSWRKGWCASKIARDEKRYLVILLFTFWRLIIMRVK